MSLSVRYCSILQDLSVRPSVRLSVYPLNNTKTDGPVGTKFCTVLRCLPGGVTWALFSPPSIGKGASHRRWRGVSRCSRRSLRAGCSTVRIPRNAISRKWEQTSSQLTCVGAKQLLFVVSTRSARFNKHQNQQRSGIRPGPHWRRLQRSPRLPSWWGGG